MSAPGFTVMPDYGTRWRRALPLALVALLLLGGCLAMVQAHVLAAPTVVFQGTLAKMSTTGVSGQDVGLGMSRISVRNPDGTTTSRTTLSTGFATSRLNGLCISQVQRLPVVGPVTVTVLAGDGDAATLETVATNVQLDLTDLYSAGTGINLDGVVTLGVASQDVTTLAGVDNPLGAPTGTGWYGIDATAGDIANVKGYLYDAQIGGPLTAPGLRITVVPGGPECWSTSVTDQTPLPR